jgi:hypothetical protein
MIHSLSDRSRSEWKISRNSQLRWFLSEINNFKVLIEESSIFSFLKDQDEFSVKSI